MLIMRPMIILLALFFTSTLAAGDDGPLPSTPPPRTTAPEVLVPETPLTPPDPAAHGPAVAATLAADAAAATLAAAAAAQAAAPAASTAAAAQAAAPAASTAAIHPTNRAHLGGWASAAAVAAAAGPATEVRPLISWISDLVSHPHPHRHDHQVVGTAAVASAAAPAAAESTPEVRRGPLISLPACLSHPTHSQ